MTTIIRLRIYFVHRAGLFGRHRSDGEVWSMTNRRAHWPIPACREVMQLAVDGPGEAGIDAASQPRLRARISEDAGRRRYRGSIPFA